MLVSSVLRMVVLAASLGLLLTLCGLLGPNT